MFEAIKNWYNAYTFQDFLIHKLTHLFVGSALGFLLGKHYLIGLLVVLTVAIGKEISDEYQSPAPFSYHVLDVVTTMLGGIIGILVYYGIGLI